MVKHPAVVGLLGGALGIIIGYIMPNNLIGELIYANIMPVGWAWLLLASALGFFTMIVPYFVSFAAGLAAGIALKINPRLTVLCTGIVLFSSGMFAVSYVVWCMKEYMVFREYQYRELADVLKGVPLFAFMGLALIILYFAVG